MRTMPMTKDRGPQAPPFPADAAPRASAVSTTAPADIHAYGPKGKRSALMK